MITFWLTQTHALALTLEPPTGLKQGHVATFSVSGGLPGQGVGLVTGGPPPGACPPILGGACLGVSAPVLVDTAVVAADGTATFQVHVPANAPLVDVPVQAVQVGAVSPVAVIPVLTASSVALTVTDAASLAVARHVWSAPSLTLDAGPYPAVLSLPLEAVDWVKVQGATRDLALPALVDATYVTVESTPGTRIDAPAWTGPAVSISIRYNTGPVVVEAPVLQGLQNLTLSGNSDRTTVDAPGVTTLAVLSVDHCPADLSGVLPSLTQASQLFLEGLTGSELVAFPVLARADDLQIWGTDLARIVQLGALVAAGNAVIGANPFLTDVSGLHLVVQDATCAANPVLPSCACDALFADAYFLQCSGNAPDTCSDDPSDRCTP